MTELFKSVEIKLSNKLSSMIDTNKNNDLFINEEHKLLCEYYKKYIELKSKLETKNKKIIIHYMKHIFNFDDYISILSHENNSIIKYIDAEYIYNIKWNDFNKKFINKLNYVFNHTYIDIFLREQYIFLSSLTTRELFNLKYYTYHGDIYINNFIQKKFTLDNIKNYSGNIVSHENDICYFFYQFKDYFTVNKYNDEVIDVTNIKSFIEFIKKECLNFDIKIYNYVFSKYLLEMKAIFKKSPKTTNKLILYRGIDDDYITSNLKKNIYYKNSQFTSTSLFLEKALAYTSRNNKKILKINVNSGLNLIFVEGISLAPQDFEVIIPINSIFYLKNKINNQPVYIKKDDIICPDEDNIKINIIELGYIY